MSEGHVPTREEWAAAFKAMRKRMYEQPAPPQFVGLSGIGFVCPSEYKDIHDRTGPYAKGAPLDLGDAYYGKASQTPKDAR